MPHPLSSIGPEILAELVQLLAAVLHFQVSLSKTYLNFFSKTKFVWVTVRDSNLSIRCKLQLPEEVASGAGYHLIKDQMKFAWIFKLQYLDIGDYDMQILSNISKFLSFIM